VISKIEKSIPAMAAALGARSPLWIRESYWLICNELLGSDTLLQKFEL